MLVQFSAFLYSLDFYRSSMIIYFYSIHNTEQHAPTMAKARKKLTFDNSSRYTLNVHLVFTHDFRSTILSGNAVKIGTMSVT